MKIKDNMLSVKCFNDSQLKNLMAYMSNSGMKINNVKIPKESGEKFPCIIYYDVNLNIKPESII